MTDDHPTDSSTDQSSDSSADGEAPSPAERAAASLLDLWHRWENPGRSANRGLNLRRIAAAAIEIADADGLAAVSMARVAERLGYTTMALYRHVSGKDELLELMSEAAFEGCVADIPDAVAWRPGLERWCRNLLAPYLRSPWLTDVNPTGLNSPTQLAAMDQGLGLLDRTGLPVAEQAAILLALSGHIVSHARLTANLSGAETGDRAPMGTLIGHLIGSGRLPWVEAAVAGGMFADYADDPDDFEFGLALILDGVESLIARSAAPQAGSPGATRDGWTRGRSR